MKMIKSFITVASSSTPYAHDMLNILLSDNLSQTGWYKHADTHKHTKEKVKELSRD